MGIRGDRRRRGPCFPRNSAMTPFPAVWFGRGGTARPTEPLGFGVYAAPSCPDHVTQRHKWRTTKRRPDPVRSCSRPRQQRCSGRALPCRPGRGGQDLSRWKSTARYARWPSPARTWRWHEGLTPQALRTRSTRRPCTNITSASVAPHVRRGLQGLLTGTTAIRRLGSE